MRWLKRDEGIAMVLVGVLLAVLLALAGMAVDLGAVFAERRELRNGADAAALAIAEDCATGAQPCDQGTAEGTAQAYADANAHDDASGVDSVVLTFTGPNTGSVRVVTSAWDAAAGEAGVRVPLMSLLGLNRVSVGAAATAIFDYPSSAEGLPVIIDFCEFLNAGGYGPSFPVTLYFHVPTSTDPPPTECPSNPANQDFPGGFGFLEPTGSECAAALTAGLWTPGDPGNSLPQPECSDSDEVEEAIYNQDILVPLYSDTDPHDKEYLVLGFGAFHVTAYNLGATKYTRPSGFECPATPGSSSACLQGWFTSEFPIYSGTPGGTDYGVVLVKLVE